MTDNLISAPVDGVKACRKCELVKHTEDFSAGYNTCKTCRGKTEKLKHESYKELHRNSVPPLPDGKKCKRCNEIKGAEDFALNRGNKDGRQYYCKSCNDACRRVEMRRIPSEMLVTKICCDCFQTKPREEFAKDKKSVTGLCGRCRKCAAEKKSKNRQRSPREVSLRNMYHRVRMHSKNTGVGSDITYEWLVQEFGHITHCPILHIPLEWGAVGRPTSYSPSIDKIVPKLGYVRGNVQLISYKANLMKNNADTRELACFGKWATDLNEKCVLEIVSYYVND